MSESSSRPRKPKLHFLSSFSSSSPPPSLSISPKSQTKMARRSFLKLTVAISLSLLALYAYFSSFLFPSNPNPNIQSNLSIPSPNSKITKIYLHDLPRKFTYGVIQSYALARQNPSAAAVLDYALKYPGHQHSAEWYLFSDLNRPDRSGSSPVQRVLNPEDADLFYVPFFSSLSLVVNPIRPDAGHEAKEAAYSDEEMQEDLMEWLEGSEYWKRNKGRDHVFICQDPNALYKVIDRVRNGVLLVSDFGRLKGDQASLVKDVILPYSHRINSYNGEVGLENRPSLLFFMGNRYRKEGGKVRDTLFQILEHQKDVIIKHGTQSRESRRMASQGMHSSKFCLHPAGDTPSACRLFDAIVSLCVPVIVSDYIELPFEDVIDYKKIAVFVDTDIAVKPGYLTSLLRGISTERILQYQRELKLNDDVKRRATKGLQVILQLNWLDYVIRIVNILKVELFPGSLPQVKRYFEYEDPNGTVNEIWRQVSSKLPLIKLMINRDKRLIKRGLDDPDCSCLCTGQNRTLAIR